jgi:hypothetical protein
MPVILASIFSAIIILITVYHILKVLSIAHKRKEITQRKRFVIAASSILTGLAVSLVLPFAYQKIMDIIYHSM